MQAPDPQTITKLKNEHPDRQLIELSHRMEHTGEQVIAIALVPSRPEWLRFSRMISDPDKRAMALEEMTRSCVVWPEPRELDAQLASLPGLAATFGNALVRRAGMSSEADVKNL